MGVVGQWVKRVSWVNGWGGSMGEKGEVDQWVKRVRWINGCGGCLELVNCRHGEVFRSCELL